MRRWLFKLALALAVAASACSGTAQKPVDNDTPAKAESLYQLSGDDPTDRDAVRRATADYIKKVRPDWTVAGIHTAIHWGNVYYAAVNITKGEQDEKVELTVTRFYPENGQPYWKAHPMSETSKDALKKGDEYQQLQQLNKDSTDDGEDADPYP